MFSSEKQYVRIGVVACFWSCSIACRFLHQMAGQPNARDCGWQLSKSLKLSRSISSGTPLPETRPSSRFSDFDLGTSVAVSTKFGTHQSPNYCCNERLGNIRSGTPRSSVNGTPPATSTIAWCWEKGIPSRAPHVPKHFTLRLSARSLAVQWKSWFNIPPTPRPPA